MKANLTKKESRFLKKYMEGATLAECAKFAGSKGKDNDVLKVVGHRMLTAINPTMPEIMELAGVTDQLLSQKIMEGLHCNNHVFASYKGKFTDERVIPDNPNRLKALDIVGKWKGLAIDRLELTGRDAGDIFLTIQPGSKQSRKEIDLE